MEWLILAMIGGVVAAFPIRMLLDGRRSRKRREQWDREEAEIYADEQRSLAALLEERRMYLLRCDVCSEKAGHDVFFEGFSWYHCPRCGGHGFMSMYAGGCTACSNMDRFGSPWPGGGSVWPQAGTAVWPQAEWPLGQGGAG